ncbi:MAG: ABC transporter permease [Paracoccaceae bacterium]|nr:ABC transporter permease [Paracoccaceae bacterium]MDE2674810.1 ABC transporter permease [Paracoccaceae bacterium]MDE2738992.1 ABC transporter permease [Paracoccaceae bacterium]MXZ50496.1 ABC transporter permease [Paracoccaceae bacterium]MYF47232.1 ABC transporter permease [Paracoccaceae bacterium]
MKSILPITTVSIVIVILWYGFSVVLNSTWTKDQANRAGVEVTFSEILKDTMVQQRPLLPAPHQVIIELWDTTVNKKITSKRSLVYHGWITLSATLLGFVIGTGLGVLLAIGIVHNKAMDYGVMPWIIASQTVPILALAPMIIVVLYSIGLSGLVPKAIISAYLSFFPVSVGMVAGFRCPDPTQMDLLKTYAAKKSQLFWKLRVPISMPYLFTSLKIGVAASLVGAIVGELPTGAVAGLGARLLTGSYYGQTVQIWSALIGSAILAAVLVGFIGLIQKHTLNRMGLAR